ncbi:thiopurine S-methyltransferase [Stutzerimonas stutzeri]|uniref:thiopurine S-methyltransferase n=1 Tax=Stutzerimonas stutzeri TaxID=316 RepID=UPI001BD107A4|nr:thiopurine S-methyltransferase [Stutzerimonas stutzeri]
MHEDFWLQRWARNEIGFHLGMVHPGLRRHWPRLGLAPGAQVLVPLCGKSVDLAWLVEQGYRVLGVELSEKAVEAFFAEQQLDAEVSQAGPFKIFRAGALEIRCGDIFALAAQDVADCQALYDRAALIALPPPMRQRYAAHLSAILPNACQQLLITLDYEQSQMDGPPFAVDTAEVTALYAADWHVELLESKEVLERNPRMRECGLGRLEERFYHLRRHA